MLTAATIIERAAQVAKVRGMTAQGLDLLNAILADLCQDYDLALARGLYTFNFNPGLASNFGSGPYNLPLDYLRASGSSGDGQKTFFWTLNGVPYPMVPCDLSEFDMQVQQAGTQSHPWLWATDMANAGTGIAGRLKLSTTLALTAGDTAARAIAGTGLAIGDGVAGEGIVPGTTLSAASGLDLTLSLAAAATLPAASVFFGVPPTAYAYPPPSGAYPVSIRYQRLLPPLTDTSQIPWFPSEGYLIDELAGRLMEISDDSRVVEFLGDNRQSGRAGRRLQRFLDKVDDKQNRPQTVELDRRRFGSAMQKLPNSKLVGW